jgi:hypothetical protein
MTAYYTAALRTTPFFFLHFQKLVYSILLDRLQVVNHAHIVVHAVAPVQLLQGFAREISALKTIFKLFIEQGFAFFLYKRAFFIPRPAPRAIRYFHTLFPEVMRV